MYHLFKKVIIGITGIIIIITESILLSYFKPFLKETPKILRFRNFLLFNAKSYWGIYFLFTHTHDTYKAIFSQLKVEGCCTE